MKSKKNSSFFNKRKVKKNTSVIKEKNQAINRKLIESNLFFRRSIIVYTVVILLFIVLFANIYYIQVISHKDYIVKSKNNYIKLVVNPPERGLILDRNGIVLAQNIYYYGLYIAPQRIKNVKNVIKNLHDLDILNISENEYNEYLKNRSKSRLHSDILLKNYLSREQAIKILSNKNLFPTASIKPTAIRYYPYGNELTHFIGYTGSINDNDFFLINQQENGKTNYDGTNSIGKIGLERFYEAKLHGIAGYSRVEVNSTGNIIDSRIEKSAINGTSLLLAIDLPTQVYARQLLKGEKATVILSDPKTSEIIAIVSEPSYDANLFTDGISSTEYNKLRLDENKPLYNRATLGVYPPGSTIKPFVAFIGLNTNYVTAQTSILDPGYWILPGTKQKYRDWLRSGHGNVNLEKSIVESVDTYYYDLSYRMGIKTLSANLSKFGFGNKTGIDILEESTGLLPTPAWKQKRFKQPWYDGDTPPVGIGQGFFSTTPIQILHALNITLNNGVEYTPHLLKNFIDFNSINEVNFNNSNIMPLSLSGNLAVTSNNNHYWNNIRNAMRGVITNNRGSGYGAFLGSSIEAAGKTGTAQVFSLKGSDYDSKNLAKKYHDHSLFTGYAPYNNPKISVVVIVENGGSGAKVAAPIARKIMEYYLNKRLPILESNLSNEEKLSSALEEIAKLGINLSSIKNEKQVIYHSKLLEQYNNLLIKTSEYKK